MILGQSAEERSPHIKREVSHCRQHLGRGTWAPFIAHGLEEQKWFVKESLPQSSHNLPPIIGVDWPKRNHQRQKSRKWPDQFLESIKLAESFEKEWKKKEGGNNLGSNRFPREMLKKIVKIYIQNKNLYTINLSCFSSHFFFGGGFFLCFFLNGVDLFFFIMAMLRLGGVEAADWSHIVHETPVERDGDDLRSADEVPEEEDIFVPAEDEEEPLIVCLSFHLFLFLFLIHSFFLFPSYLFLDSSQYHCPGE